MSESIFAERRFELGSGTLTIRFFMPIEAGGEYQCNWTIGWPDREKNFQAYGHDSLAALLLAIKMVRSNLLESDAYKAGQLTHLGNPDLWLPSFGEASSNAAQSGNSASEIAYLNTDLDLFSTRDITALTAGLEERGLGIHHVGQHEGLWRAHLDMDECYETPELTIRAMLDVVETLPPALEDAWAACTRREFNMGFECGDRPWPFEQALPGELLGRAAAVGAGLGITLYPRARPKSDPPV